MSTDCAIRCVHNALHQRRASRPVKSVKRPGPKRKRTLCPPCGFAPYELWNLCGWPSPPRRLFERHSACRWLRHWARQTGWFFEVNIWRPTTSARRVAQHHWDRQSKPLNESISTQIQHGRPQARSTVFYGRTTTSVSLSRPELLSMPDVSVTKAAVSAKVVCTASVRLQNRRSTYLMRVSFPLEPAVFHNGKRRYIRTYTLVPVPEVIAYDSILAWTALWASNAFFWRR